MSPPSSEVQGPSPPVGSSSGPTRCSSPSTATTSPTSTCATWWSPWRRHPPQQAAIAVFHAPRPEACGILEVDGGVVVSFEEKPAAPRSDLANAGMYAFRRSVLDLVPESPPSRHRHPPAAQARAAIGRRARHERLPHGHRHPGGAGARRGRVAPARSRVIVTQTPLRVGLVGGGYRPAVLLPAARWTRPQRSHRQVRLRRGEAALRRRHLPQLLPEGDRVAGRGRRARPRARGHAHGRCPWGRRDHDSCRHPVGGVGSRVVVLGHRGAPAGPVRLPGTPAVGRGARRASLHHRDRPVWQAHREAGPVRRGVRRHL